MGALSATDRKFCEALSLLELGPFVQRYEWVGNGCPPQSRAALCKAFLAKSIYQFPTTGALLQALESQANLRRLCGWDTAGSVPSEATFSRAFAAFAKDELAQKLHERLIAVHAKEKLVGHVSRDATAIAVPERPVVKAPKPVDPVKKKRGRPAKDEVRPPAAPKRLDLQGQRELAANLADLPLDCTIGAKLNSRGHMENGIGYKLHLDTIDGDIPVSAVLTSASVHDSQVAIPLAQMTAQRVTSLYDLMDSAYDAPQIWEFSARLGHVPIIDRNPRRGEQQAMEPACKQRFRERTSAERVNSALKERYGGRWVRVRGHAKVLAHLMFGLLAVTAAALLARAG
jgi:hypothetical protein